MKANLGFSSICRKAWQLGGISLAVVIMAGCAVLGETMNVAPIVVDNDSLGFEVLFGEDLWKESTRDPGFEGAGYLWCRPKKLPGNGNELVRWKLPIQKDGAYRVYAKWVASKPDDRATNAPYIIMHRDGQAMVRVNQADLSLAGKWNELGTFPFSSGRKAQIILSSFADNTVVADAVKLVYEGPASPAPVGAEDFTLKCAERGKVVFADDFSGGLENWIFEGSGEVAIRDGRLRVKTTPMPGHMAWIRTSIPAAFRLEFDVIPLTPSGFWLVFFCSTVPGAQDIFAPDLPAREGIFDNYVRTDGFQCYHISYRRNLEANCNLRKNPHMHLLRQETLEGVIPANRTYHVEITYKGGHILLRVDGKTFMEYEDTENVYGAGYIALRNIYDCETEYDNVVVYDLTEE